MRSADGRFEFRDESDEPCKPGTPALQVHRIAFICRLSKDRAPCSAAMCSLNLRDRGHDLNNRSWGWDGNFDAHTLHPSVNCTPDLPSWHGYIKGGKFYKQDGTTLEPMQ